MVRSFRFFISKAIDKIDIVGPAHFKILEKVLILPANFTVFFAWLVTLELALTVYKAISS